MYYKRYYPCVQGILYRQKKLFVNKGLYDTDDLISEGNIGIIDAINTYKMSSRYNFSSYCYWLILLRINNFVKKNTSCLTHIPISRLFKFLRGYYTGNQKNNYANNMLYSSCDYNSLSGVMYSEISKLNFNQYKDILLEDILRSRDMSVEEYFIKEDSKRLIHKQIKETIESLSKRLKHVFDLRYNTYFNGKKQYTYRQIAKKLGISFQAVHDYDKRLQKQLRGKLWLYNIERI